MRHRLIALALLFAAAPAPALAGDLFKYAGVREHGFHFLEGAHAEFGVVDPDKAKTTAVFGLNSTMGTLFNPALDFTIGMRYWSADLEPGENGGSHGSLSDFSLHGDLNYGLFSVFNMKTYALGGVGAHFAGADVPTDQQLQDALGGFGLGLDLGIGIRTQKQHGLGIRGEIRKEITDQVGNWNYTVGVGWWPNQKAVRAPQQASATPTSTSTPTPTSTPATTAPPASGGVSAADAAAMQATIDRLTAENNALKSGQGAAPAAGTTGAAGAAPTAESRATAQRNAYSTMARLSGDPSGFSDTPDGPRFASEKFINFGEGGSKLDVADQEQIRRLAVLLMMFPGSKAALEGHGDSSGTPAANQKVTTARANAVRNELLRLGVPASAVTAQGIGSARPVEDNGTASGRSANRRVSVVVTGAPNR